MVSEYADFTDLSEKVYYPEDFNLAGLGNNTLSWSTSGKLVNKSVICEINSSGFQNQV